MLKKILSIVILMCLLLSSALVFYINYSTPSNGNPVNLTNVEKLKGYLPDKRILWTSPENEIKSFVVIRDEPSLLEVKVDYRYSGDQGAEVSTCGGITENLQSIGAKWSCRPTRLKNGDHSAVLHFELIDDLPGEFQCSQSIQLSMYKHRGGNFYSDFFHYKKAWLKDEKGLLAKIKQFIYLKTTCS